MQSASKKQTRAGVTGASVFNSRLSVYGTLVCAFALLVLIKLFSIAVGQHAYYVAQAQSQQSYVPTVLPDRGEIFITDKYSATPYPVATNKIENTVYTVPTEVTDPNTEAGKLATILGADTGMTQDTILQKLTTPQRAYVPIASGLSDADSSAITAANLAGVFLEPEEVRYYPEGNFMSQVLGFVGYPSTGTTKVGLYGLERYEQPVLAGTGNSASTVVDGSSLLLTVDRSIQHEVETVLSQVVQQHGADSGNVIVANPKTGAILAMATYPSFDPNAFNQVTDLSVFQNEATNEEYEPGSTMKAVTLSAALDQNLITPQSTYNNTGSLQVSGYTIHNSEMTDLGPNTTMTAVIDHSLNTGAAYVEGLLGNAQFLTYLNKFRFGKATDIELPEETGDLSNLTPNAAQINYDTASFGQGITVTPIQMLQAYQAIANGGLMMEPYIIDSVVAPDGDRTTTAPTSEGQIISSSASQLMTSMLVDDVEHGYGAQAGVKGYYIAGKTGTAQVATSKGYIANDNIGSFVGYGPVNDPQFVMIVNINNPRDVAFAETTAAPAFGQIAKFILNYYQVPTTR